ncbi:hypothetical protein EYF80_008037 [Liparis tanakae]|uniref:Uncharacterized protein n=1 Tax=Liparis tanakae TaxID=230148 RepID=A0A4Z2IUU1_9TELE|nr:hypothetical protein EYF80_008037 [Liparis tanakae]
MDWSNWMASASVSLHSRVMDLILNSRAFEVKKLSELFDRVVRSLEKSDFYKTSEQRLGTAEFQWLNGLVII